MSIKRILVDEFTDEIKDLGNMELGTDKYRTTVDGVTKLADRIIEMEKLEVESSKIIDDRENENCLRLKQMEDEKKDRFVKNCIAGITGIGGLGVGVWVYLTSMKYDEKGVLPSTEGARTALRQLLRFTK